MLATLDAGAQFKPSDEIWFELRLYQVPPVLTPLPLSPIDAPGSEQTNKEGVCECLKH
jgi:hypothetical protein